MASAVSATGSMSQLIKAAAATQGDAAIIIASHGRPTGVRTKAQSAIRKKSAEQHGVDVNETSTSSRSAVDQSVRLPAGHPGAG